MVNNLSLNELNNRFSFETSNSKLHFKTGQGDIPLLEVKNNKARAVISLQGAHILSWKPAGQDDVIWLSKGATFAPGKSVRGGIPICWPWFGAHENNSSFPAHGFARTVLWQVIGVKEISAAETQITFKLDTSDLDDTIQQMWPFATSAEYRVTISDSLKLELITRNNSNEELTIGQALHTYFNINDITTTSVTGLEGKTYLDKTENFDSKTQEGIVSISEEVDRVYLDTPDDVIIDNKKRKIRIKKQGSFSTVVWNPWKEVAEKMGDLGEGGYKQMLCVESANAATDTITIKPGENHTLQVIYEVDN